MPGYPWLSILKYEPFKRLLEALGVEIGFAKWWTSVKSHGKLIFFPWKIPKYQYLQTFAPKLSSFPRKQSVSP